MKENRVKRVMRTGPETRLLRSFEAQVTEARKLLT
jgi:hypothetical protein